HDFPALILGSILQREQQRVVECCFVSGDGRANGVQNLGPVGGKSSCPRKIAVVGIERNLVRALQRTNKLGNRILRKNEAAIKVVAGIKQNKYIGARYQRTESRRRASEGSAAGQAGGRVCRRFGLWLVNHSKRRSIAFRKGGNLLCNSILNNGKILGMQAGNILPIFVGHCDVELYQVDNDVNIGALLS